MLVVVDCNRVISSLLTKGKIFTVFLLNSVVKKLEFVAPEYLFFEIVKNFDVILSKIKLDKEELAEVFSFLKEHIGPVPFKEFNKYAEEAKELAPHDKDLQYFALALASKSGIWSDEDRFREQDKIKIFSRDKLLSMLFSSIFE